MTSACEDGVGVVLGGVEEEILEVDMDLQLSEYIDQLSDKKLVVLALTSFSF